MANDPILIVLLQDTRDFVEMMGKKYIFNIITTSNSKTGYKKKLYINTFIRKNVDYKINEIILWFNRSNKTIFSPKFRFVSIIWCWWLFSWFSLCICYNFKHFLLIWIPEIRIPGGVIKNILTRI